MTALTLTREALDRLMPMHLCVADCGLVHFAGPTMAKVMPTDARDITDIFADASGFGPGHVAGAIAAAVPGQRLALRLRHQRKLVLRGHIVTAGAASLLMDFGFGVSLSEAVATFGLTEADFAPSELVLEFMFLQEANRAIRQELSRFNRHLMLAREDARREAHTDALTGLLNRRGLHEAMRNTLDRQVKSQDFALVHLDLDNFKQVNDRLGHGAGDRLLVDTARILGRAVRIGDLVARIGGDEFVLILRGVWTRQSLQHLACRIIRGIEASSPSGCAVSASLGVVLSAGYGDDAFARMLEDADAALYQSKGDGKGRLTIAPLPQNLRPRPAPQ